MDGYVRLTPGEIESMRADARIWSQGKTFAELAESIANERLHPAWRYELVLVAKVQLGIAVQVLTDY